MGRLHEKHAVAEWKFGIISAFAWTQTETKKTCVELADYRPSWIHSDISPANKHGNPLISQKIYAVGYWYFKLHDKKKSFIIWINSQNNTTIVIMLFPCVQILIRSLGSCQRTIRFLDFVQFKDGLDAPSGLASPVGLLILAAWNEKNYSLRTLNYLNSLLIIIV